MEEHLGTKVSKVTQWNLYLSAWISQTNYTDEILPCLSTSPESLRRPFHCHTSWDSVSHCIEKGNGKEEEQLGRCWGAGYQTRRGHLHKVCVWVLWLVLRRDPVTRPNREKQNWGDDSLNIHKEILKNHPTWLQIPIYQAYIPRCFLLLGWTLTFQAIRFFIRLTKASLLLARVFVSHSANSQ